MTRKNAFFFAAACLALALVAGVAIAQVAVPKLTARVNDYANLLDQSQRSRIEQGLAQFEAQTTTQVTLLTVPTLDGESIEGFSIRVVEQWKIGQKGKDNGVLLLIAPKERKVRIEVGYGLEGALTDLESSQIIRNIIVPAFQTGNYYPGIVGGLDGIMKATMGEFTAPVKRSGRGSYEGRKKPSVLTTILGILVFIVLLSTRTGRSLLFFMLIFGGRGGRVGGGGGFGGGGGGFGGGGASGGW